MRCQAPVTWWTGGPATVPQRQTYGLVQGDPPGLRPGTKPAATAHGSHARYHSTMLGLNTSVAARLGL